ncbi:MAG: hypothetical protein QOK03_1919, partial [Candidatus Binataceae bacterium]|nr:hypothetical protein [Candidatus Binataceae bacterium]
MPRCFVTHLLGLILVLLVSWVPIACAQNSMEVPPPASQSQPPLKYRPKPTPRVVPPPPPRPLIIQPSEPNLPDQSEQSELTPATPSPPPVQPPQEAPPPSYQIQQPVLPAIFRGCWQGKVEFLDSIRQLPGAPKTGVWTPKTYRLCYQRYGDGPFRLTFSEAGIDRDSRITNPQSSMSLLSTDGRTYATMRALLHFDEYNNRGGGTFAVDETARLQCDIEPDGMHVIGSVHGTR